MTRTVDIYTYMPILQDILKEGKSVNLVITGNSMAPFLVHLRDTIIISSVNQPLRRGDMVFYTRDSGQYVMHRIHHIDKSGNLFIVGDAQTEIEGPIRQDQVFGIINQVIRKGKLVGKGDFWFDFFYYVYIRLVPLRPYIVKLVSLIKRK